MSRLRRKDIKRDEVLDSVGRAVAWTQENTRTVIAIVAGLIAAAIVVAIFFAVRSKQTARSNEMLAGALRIYDAPIDAGNPRPDDDSDPAFADEESRRARAVEAFTELREQYAGKPIGGVAAAYLGDLAASDGDLEAAEAHWRQSLEDSPKTLLAGRVQMSLINMIASRDGADAAIEELRGILSSGSGTLPDDVVLYELAKVLEDAGRPDEATSTYERLIDEYPQSIYSPEAERKLDTL